MIPKETLKQKFVAIQNHIYKIEGELILLKQRLMYFESLLDDETVAALENEKIPSVTTPKIVENEPTAFVEPETPATILAETEIELQREINTEIAEIDALLHEPEVSLVSEPTEIKMNEESLLHSETPLEETPIMQFDVSHVHDSVEKEIEQPLFIASDDVEAPLPFYIEDHLEESETIGSVVAVSEGQEALYEKEYEEFIPPEERQIAMPFEAAVPPIDSEEHNPSKTVQTPAPEVVSMEMGHQPENLNERLAKLKTNKDVSESLSSKALSDLKGAINLNLKLGFIRKLFGEDVIAYSATIEKLNTCGSMDTAMAIYKQKSQEFAWGAEEEELAMELETLVRRRWM